MGPTDILSDIQQVKPNRTHPLGEVSFGTQDARRELLEKIASSTTFRKSNRLRELLLYLGDRSVLEPSVAIREQELGVHVFERPANYDTGQDPIVRVQMSQLRKRLEHYFAEEGWGESLTIEIPRGSYTLQFRSRSVLEQVAIVQPKPRHNITTFWLGAMALILLTATIILALQNVQLRQQADFGLGPHPTATQFWKQMFGNGLETYMALADGTLVVFEDQISKQISVQDYENKNFDELTQQRIHDPAVRQIVTNLLGWSFTGLGDANLARRIGLLSSSAGIRMDVMLARSLSTQQVSKQNGILFGSRRADPWISLFEDQLNFQTVFEESPRTAFFVNRKPQPGEPGTYPGEWSKTGFCRVAYLSNPKGTGSTLLISGTSMASTEAGGEFITSEKALQQLRSQLHLSWREPFPHFEVLLKVRIVNNAISQYEVVAWRLH